MAELKQSRWVKVMKPGDAKPEEKDNVMNISIGEKCCEADAVYTVRNQKKAAQWLLKYLDYANASQVMHEVADRIEKEAESSDDLALNAESWNCEISKVQENTYKVRFVWVPSEPMTKKKPARRPRKASVAAKAPAKKAAPKKKAPAKKTPAKKAPAMSKEQFKAKMLADKAEAKAE